MRQQFTTIGSAILICFFVGEAAAQETVVPKIDFRQQIQPLLARNCYACHGPDAEKRAADLRLDQEEVAKDYAIVPGNADASELITRIFSDDSEEVMPPPETGHKLTAVEKQSLKLWIEQGATWQRHWAFEPIGSPMIPTANIPAAYRDWARNDIDRFVLPQLVKKELSPAAPADKATLLRRVYFDLIGLPPTSQQRNTFLADHSPAAFEKVVDELLANPHYGEQMAVGWLDAARFADTNGFQNDFVRNMWPWRDWVINAFNQNLPYDDFIVQQIAGDLLPDATQFQVIATGFNRNNRSNTEGGSIEAEWAVENCIDRVEATSGAFLGLTMGCARCHDHKYDPISQTEFYEFFAFFNNVDEKGFYQETRGNVGPLVTVASSDQEQLAELAGQIENLKQQIESKKIDEGTLQQCMDRWRNADQADSAEPLPQPVFQLTDPETTLATSVSPVGIAWNFVGQVDTFAAKPPGFEFDTDVPFTWSAWISGGARGAIFGQMDEDHEYRGVDGLLLADGKLKIHLIHQWQSNAIAVITVLPLPEVAWTFVSVTYDGKSKADGCRVYFDGQPMEVSVEVDSLSGTIQSPVPFKIGQRNHSEFLQGSLSDFRLFDREFSEEQVNRLLHNSLIANFDSIAQTKAADESDPEIAGAPFKILETYVSQAASTADKRQLAQVQSKHDELLKTQPTTMVMRDQAGYRDTYLLKRGQYDLPDKSLALFPSIPAALPPLADGQPRNRLGLAQWMVDDRNPLVARVAVNRTWSQFFGQGLVSPPDNFGLQGTPPTHPELLDWLASDFRSHNWDLKRLQKKIVLSATYQQSSVRTPDLLEHDPDNIWLARGPRYRLSAEQVRDQAIYLGGLLVHQIGGPSVFPYQPDGLWEELAGGANNGPYKQSTGEALYRRSLYTYRKRTVSHPTLATFGAPSWEICQLYRARTNTPLQSLALLNDVTYVEASRGLAERMLTEPKSNDVALNGKQPNASVSIRYGFLLTHLREPTESELKTLADVYSELHTYYQQHLDEAQQLVSSGDSKRDDSLAVERMAAMTSVATILLNADEVISKE